MKDEKTFAVLLIGVLAAQLLFLGALFVKINTINESIGGLYQTIASLSIGNNAAEGQPTGMVREVVPDVVPGSGPSLGPEDAPVTIVEFSDFSCTACRTAQSELKELVEDAGGGVRLVYRHHPGDTSSAAALAAECASWQNAFWPMHDRLFAHFGDYAPDKLLAHAAEIGLDSAEFQACMESPRALERLRHDLQAAREYGVSGTPTVLVNGRMVLGVYPKAALEHLVAEIRRQDGV